MFHRHGIYETEEGKERDGSSASPLNAMSWCSLWLMGLSWVSLTDCRVCQSLWADSSVKLYGQPDRLGNHIFVLIPRTQRLSLKTTPTHGIEAGWCAQSIEYSSFLLQSFLYHKFSLWKVVGQPMLFRLFVLTIVLHVLPSTMVLCAVIDNSFQCHQQDKPKMHPPVVANMYTVILLHTLHHHQIPPELLKCSKRWYKR
jgi:hypothetical protein